MNADVAIFKGRLTALGGRFTRKVEVYDGEMWNDTVIPSIGNKDGKLAYLTSLATESHLFVFGKIFIY